MARKKIKTVWVRVRPYRGIGGVGGPGTVAQMSEDMAAQYVHMGYVDIVEPPDDKTDNADDAEAVS